MKQFEIWWANLPAPAGKRPVLLLGRNDAYEYLNKFIVAEITTTIRSIPVEVMLGPREGLTRRCAANCDNLRTIARSTIGKRIGALHGSRHIDVKRAIGYALAWEELIMA
ncbi:MAG: type II toxin-antitoxin system PemK/MazF family toxin [Bryobacteraceae bacterium]